MCVCASIVCACLTVRGRGQRQSECMSPQRLKVVLVFVGNPVPLTALPRKTQVPTHKLLLKWLVVNFRQDLHLLLLSDAPGT